VFKLFDADGSGSIDTSELYGILTVLGMGLSKRDTRALIANLDAVCVQSLKARGPRVWQLEVTSMSWAFVKSTGLGRCSVTS
jgi:hypothetical protein